MKIAEQLLVLSLAIEAAAESGVTDEVTMLLDRRQTLLDLLAVKEITPEIMVRIQEVESRIQARFKAEQVRISRTLREILTSRGRSRPYGRIGSHSSPDLFIAA